MRRIFGVAIAGLILGCFQASLESNAKPLEVSSNQESILIADKKGCSKAKKKKSSKKQKRIKRGMKIFGSHCASCHAGGGNVVKPSRSIKGSGTLATYATFKAYLNKPIGDMPHYEHLITNDSALKDLYEYTKTFDKEENKAKSKKKSKSKKR